ncbi:MAG: ferrous iron transporter B, partial [Flavobacteriaceae bacterium]|nr:ferrous iron transporter B [Flavobacteriaceae bacterium]
TLATIYSVGNDDENNSTIKQRMAAEINADTGKPLFNFPVGMSLLVFYAFAMQCVSTLAIVKRETNSWKWPLLQLFGMGILAYVAAFLTYSILA